MGNTYIVFSPINVKKFGDTLGKSVLSKSIRGVNKYIESTIESFSNRAMDVIEVERPTDFEIYIFLERV